MSNMSTIESARLSLPASSCLRRLAWKGASSARPRYAGSVLNVPVDPPDIWQSGNAETLVNLANKCLSICPACLRRLVCHDEFLMCAAQDLWAFSSRMLRMACYQSYPLVQLIAIALCHVEFPFH